jgi:hypothetical protein
VVAVVARRPKLKMLTAVPGKFQPDFIDRMHRSYALGRIVLERREALRAHVGGDASYIQDRLITRALWLELLIETYEQKVANGEEIDIGAITQLNNTLKGLYKDLGLKSTPRPVKTLRDHLEAAP